MYIPKDDITTCRCGLKIDEITFVTDDCIICYCDDYSAICILCGNIDNYEYFTNQLCVNCFEWCTA